MIDRSSSPMSFLHNYLIVEFVSVRMDCVSGPPEPIDFSILFAPNFWLYNLCRHLFVLHLLRKIENEKNNLGIGSVFVFEQNFVLFSVTLLNLGENNNQTSHSCRCNVLRPSRDKSDRFFRGIKVSKPQNRKVPKECRGRNEKKTFLENTRSETRMRIIGEKIFERS